MEEKKQKRVLTIELDENVKKVSITGLGDDETVVMKQELSEDELDQATGGRSISPGGREGYNPDYSKVNASCPNNYNHICRTKSILN